ncbi:uncharacterized protein [Miscanthus floridulus]|uniref:uncharacterized protein n=1 Tax=Miscanthus floridulus TaxID=154761 RepID=UPI0034592F39
MVVSLSFSPPLFSLPLLLCSLHGRQGRTGPAGGARGRPRTRWPRGWATGRRGRGHAGAGRGRAGRGGGPPVGVAGGMRGWPGTCWPRGGPPAGVAGRVWGRPGTAEAGDDVAPTTTALDGPGYCSGGAGMVRGGLRWRGDGAGAGERLRRRGGPAAARGRDAGRAAERKG